LNTSREKPGRIYSLLIKEARTPDATYTDLSTVLRLNDPSQAENKLRNDSIDSIDPVIDHLMSSKAFKLVVWSFVLGVLALGIPWTITLGASGGDSPSRMMGLELGVPSFIPFNVVTSAVAMVCSRRLR
jgi:hypothetical protein